MKEILQTEEAMRIRKCILTGLILTGFIFSLLSVPVKMSIAEQETIEQVVCPIIMYHHITNKASFLGRDTITPAEMERDLKVLTQLGYNTVTMKMLEEYVAGSGALPPNPIILSFDDGFLSMKTHLFPLLEKYNQCAIVSVEGSFCQRFTDTPDPNPIYGYLSWNDVKELSVSGRIEIQNHTWDMHYSNKNKNPRKGVLRVWGEDDTVYRQKLSDDISMLQGKLHELNIYPNTFTYPFGNYTKVSEEIIKELGFKASFSCAKGINVIRKGHPEDLYLLKRFNRPHGKSSEVFFDNIRKQCGKAIK